MGTSQPANRFYVQPSECTLPSGAFTSVASGTGSGACSSGSSPRNSSAVSKKGSKNGGALFGGLSTCAGLMKSCKDLTVIRSKKPSVGIIPWISAAVLGGALLVGVPAGLFAIFGSGTVATIAGGMSAVPAASTATIAGPLLPSLGALATILMNQADTDGKIIESTNGGRQALPPSSTSSGSGGSSVTSTAASTSNKTSSSMKRAGATSKGAGVAFSAFANSFFGRGRRRAF